MKEGLLVCLICVILPAHRKIPGNCFKRFKDSSDGGAQHMDTWGGEKQDPVTHSSEGKKTVRQDMPRAPPGTG